jgi:hypothetical protein
MTLPQHSSGGVQGDGSGDKELSRLQILIGLANGRTRVDDAAALMGMGRRQVYRLLDAILPNGHRSALIFTLLSAGRYGRVEVDAGIGACGSHDHRAKLNSIQLGINHDCNEDRHAGTIDPRRSGGAYP